MIINTPSDIQNAGITPERTAFLQTLLNDYVVFDDAIYPDDYDHSLQEGESGYVAPVIRKEWNSAAAAAWGFASREQIEVLLN